MLPRPRPLQLLQRQQPPLQLQALLKRQELLLPLQLPPLLPKKPSKSTGCMNPPLLILSMAGFFIQVPFIQTL